MYPAVCVVVFFHSVFLFCRSSLSNYVQFPLCPTILLHARASLHNAISVQCACAVPIWSELPDLHLLPVATSGLGWGAPADGSQEVGNRVYLPDKSRKRKKWPGKRPRSRSFCLITIATPSSRDSPSWSPRTRIYKCRSASIPLGHFKSPFAMRGPFLLFKSFTDNNLGTLFQIP